jgi:hypothetical protein
LFRTKDSVAFDSDTQNLELSDIVRQDRLIEDIGHRGDIPDVRPDAGVPFRTVVRRRRK